MMKTKHIFWGLLYLALIVAMAWLSRHKAVQWSRSEAARIERLKQQGALPGGPSASGGPGRLSAMSGIFNPQPDSDAHAEATVEASRLTRELMESLGSRLKSTLEAGDAGAALEVCATLAQDLTGAVAPRAAVVVRRTTLQPRNPRNLADEFERRWLELVAESTAEQPALIYSEVVPGDAGSVYRQLTPIYLQPLCLVCHGVPAQIDPQVREALARKYPTDLATGYREGQLRGAVSISIPLERVQAEEER